MNDTATEVKMEPEVSSQTETVTQTQPAAVAEPAPVDVVGEIVTKLQEPVATAGAAGAYASAETPVEKPMDSRWLSLGEIQTLPSFRKLTKTSAMLLLEFWRTGSRLDAVKSVLDVEGEPARLAALLFDRGNLREALLDMTGVSQKDRVLAAITRAVRSRTVSREKVELLKLQAKIILGVDADADAADEQTATERI